MFGKKLVNWIMLTTNIVAALFLLLTLIGTILSPEKFVYPAYFALIYPFIIISNVGFVLFWILTRKWVFLLSLSLLILSANEINTEFPIHFGKIEAETTNHPINILTYNTMGCGFLKKHTKRKPNKVIQYILNKNADIVCLQEFEVSTKKEYITIEDMMRIFKNYPYKHIEFKTKVSTTSFGIATFSKYPIVNKQLINYTSDSNMSIYTDININGTVIRVFNNHLESNRITESDKVLAVQLKEKFDAENLTGITLHFTHKLGTAYKIRARQADVVSGLVHSSPHKTLVCGDFNDVPCSYTYTKIKGNLKDTFSEIGTGLGWTFKEPFYGFRIDYVLYDASAFTPIQYKSDKVNYSDHYPVFCQIKMNDI